MDQGPLVAEEIDAGLALVNEFARVMPVESAFWVKAADENQRYLYIVSPQINDENFVEAYREILRIANQLNDPYLDPFRVKVSGSGTSLAGAVEQLQRQFGARRPTRLGAQMLGGASIDDLYVYPNPLPATTSSAK